MTLIKAAKAAGAASVTFPDGTIVTIAPTALPASDGVGETSEDVKKSLAPVAR